MEDNKNTEKVISINEDYRVRISDEWNWTIDKKFIVSRKVGNVKAENLGKEVWRAIGYYGNIGQVIKAIADLGIRDNVGDLAKIEKFYNDIVRFGEDILSRWKEIKEMPKRNSR